MPTSSTNAAATTSTSIMKVQVAIVGAGAAGLQASRLLCEAGMKSVLLVEARDRIGGRIHTSTCQVGGTTTINHDEGAAWVHGIGYDWPSSALDAEPPNSIPRVNPMLALLQESTQTSRKELFERQLNPIFKRGNPWMRPKHCLFEDGQLAVYANGHVTSDKILKKSLDRHWKIMDAVDDIGQTLVDTGRADVTMQQSLHDTLQRVLARKEIVRHKKVFGSEYRTMEALREFYVHLIEVWYAGSAEQLQLREFMDEEEEKNLGPADVDFTGEGDFYGPHCTVQSGMSSLLKPLMNHGEEILLEQEVTQIRHADDTVVLETKKGLVIHADACIVAIPLACLKASGGNLFEPKLSTPKQESLDILRVGHYKKVFLTFDSIFWPADPAFVGFLLPSSNINSTTSNSTTSSTLKTQHLLADNLWARKGLPCLEIILIRDAVAWANGKATEEIRDAVLDFLDEAVEDVSVHELCTDCKVTRWEEDPFSLGAYSTFGTGCEERHTEALREPEWGGRLIFAGEHTISEFEGSVHAALFSGYDSSKAVLDFLSNKK
jgi:monoamine oxidase